MNENKITYPSANGETAVFYFNFPFFQNEDVKVFQNGREVPRDRYSVRKNESDAAGDVPYVGGSVKFAAPPAAGTKIAIIRRLNLTRSIDYQPTVPINQTLLNRDLNFFLEAVREFGERLDDLLALENFDSGEILAEIEEISARVSALGDAADLASMSDIPDMQPITDAIALINAALAETADQIAALESAPAIEPADYIVAASAAGANPWYRRWNSGWVEQGGNATTTAGSAGVKVDFPIAMANTSYVILIGATTLWATPSDLYCVTYQSKTTSSVNFRGVYGNSGATAFYTSPFSWEIKGMAAA